MEKNFKKNVVAYEHGTNFKICGIKNKREVTQNVMISTRKSTGEYLKNMCVKSPCLHHKKITPIYIVFIGIYHKTVRFWNEKRHKYVILEIINDIDDLFFFRRIHMRVCV